MSGSAMSQTEVTPAKARVLRWVVWTVVLAVMALGFVGYLTPGMRMNWEAIAAMCGF